MLAQRRNWLDAYFFNAKDAKVVAKHFWFITILTTIREDFVRNFAPFACALRPLRLNCGGYVAEQPAKPKPFNPAVMSNES